MERNVLKTIGALLFVTALTGCADTGSILEVLRGNLAYSRGDYQNALVHYMVALEDNPEDSWTRYNIGNVYYALGEHDAASQIWHEARAGAESVGAAGSTELSLIYATSYNRGVLFYQQGSYEEAYQEFRYALSVTSRGTDAKANLELALGKIRASEAAAGGAAPPAAGVGPDQAEGSVDDGPGEQTLRILEYVRRKETQQWFANRDIESQDQLRDW